MPLFQTFNQITHGLYEAFKGPAFSFCDLETTDDATTLIAGDGSLVSAFQIFGTYERVWEESRKGIVWTFTSPLLNGFLEHPVPDWNP
ncbi:MAG: hypothetical protein LBF22_01945 [Deltaproteobacteria bacterium]|jgi:hypothetical protein|nr:hypothetical protein [Deltaproteobacteria bacterium]